MSTKIGLIISSVRSNRFADKPLAWFQKRLAARGGVEIEVLDLREWDLPLFDEQGPPAAVQVQSARAVAWEKKLNELDGFVVLTAEYNHSMTGALKNAFDYAWTGWQRKPIGCVGYGGVGAARAVEHVRQVAINLRMVPLAPAVHIGGADFVKLSNGASFADIGDHLEKPAADLIDDLLWWTNTLQSAKSN